LKPAPDASDYDWPEPKEGDEDDEALYDSSRGYLEQLDHYHRHQGKEEAPVLYARRQDTKKRKRA
jgi:hypothetical protein